MLLRQFGYSHSLEEVKRITPVGQAGTTLKELRDAGNRLGLQCDMIQTDIDSLKKLNKCPCIVLVNSGGLIPDENGNTIPGHYLVLTRFSQTDDFLELIDGTYGLPFKFTKAHFLEVWSGVALVPRDRSPPRTDLMLTAAHAMAWFFLIRLQLTRRTDKKASPLKVTPDACLHH